MKKLLEIFVDFLLLCFLLIILSVPLLVSLNLDPQLFIPESRVAGVSDVFSDQDIPFTFEEANETSEQIKQITVDQRSNGYFLDFKIDSNGVLSDSYEFGTLRNDSTSPIDLDVRVYANKDALSGVVSELMIENNKYLLFNGEDFSDIHITLEPNGKVPLKLALTSNVAINYDIPLTLEVRGVKKS